WGGPPPPPLPFFPQKTPKTPNTANIPQRTVGTGGLQGGEAPPRHPGGRSALPGVSRLPKFSERDCVPRTSRSNIQSRQRSRPHRSNRLPAVSFSLSAIRWEATFRESNVSSVFHFPERGCPHPQRPRKLSRKWTSSPPLRRKG